ncbi:poly(A) RNA polymerase, mitochondrial-like [Panonychus citri]|uniref:poly(A) RNA polymerase, mitochondrial-like n=1 Tax=Panonychus citri TaxID=50023 RepID=UPI002306E5E5|nr:poly(A) RNA polymerase, mitochondrial-like [Panonychus citri]
MVDAEKEEAKNYILLEDKTLRLKVTEKSILETILDSPVNNYWDYWIKDKHFFLIRLKDSEEFISKSKSIICEAKFPIMSKFFSITKLPHSEKKLPEIAKNRSDIRLNRQSCKLPENLDPNRPVDETMRKFIRNLALSELECKLKFFIINSFEELLCRGVFGAFQLTPFGSSVNGLGWGSSGLDLCLTTKYQPDPNPNFVASSAGLLDGSMKRQRCIKMYTTLMRVGLIPGVNNANQPNNQTVQLFSNFTSTDITITCTDPVTLEFFKMSEILYQLTRADERLFHLFHFCKLWAEVQGCISPTFSHFNLTMLIISYLQVKRPFPVVPPLEPFFQSTQIQLESEHIQDQSSSFTDILQGFFHHIGTFDFTSSGANLFLGKTIRKPNRDVLLILDPARSSNMAVKVTKNDLENLTRIALKSYRLMGSGCNLQNLLRPIAQDTKKKIN